MYIRFQRNLRKSNSDLEGNTTEDSVHAWRGCYSRRIFSCARERQDDPSASELGLLQRGKGIRKRPEAPQWFRPAIRQSPQGLPRRVPDAGTLANRDGRSVQSAVRFERLS